MHEIRFPLALRPDPAGGAYSAPQTSWLYLRGGSRRERRWLGREERGRRETRPPNILA